MYYIFLSQNCKVSNRRASASISPRRRPPNIVFSFFVNAYFCDLFPQPIRVDVALVILARLHLRHAIKNELADVLVRRVVEQNRSEHARYADFQFAIVASSTSSHFHELRVLCGFERFKRVSIEFYTGSH